MFEGAQDATGKSSNCIANTCINNGAKIKLGIEIPRIASKLTL